MVLPSYLELGLVFIKIIHGAGKIVDSVINRLRVLGFGSHNPTQFFWEYIPRMGYMNANVERFTDFEKNAASYETEFLALIESVDCSSCGMIPIL